MRLPILLIGLAVLLTPSPSSAHSAPFSYLDLNIQSDHIAGSLVVHNFDAAHDLGIESPERLLDPATAEAVRERLVALLSPRLTIAAERLLTVEWQNAQVLPEQNGIRLTFRVDVSKPGMIALRMRLFPYDPVHQTFVNIYEGGEVRQQLVFAGDAPERVYYAGTTQGAIAVLRSFVPSGLHHILIGPDHILFLVGLLLLGGTWRRLVSIVTAFTLGHSITLSLAALNLLNPPARLIEPAIALSIVFVGADNLVKGMGRDLRTWVALVFGLVHGFGFAYVLREFGLPAEALGWSLFSFNLGVEIGQLLIVLMVSTALALLRRRSDVVGHRVAWAGSVLVIVAGAYWFVERVFFRARERFLHSGFRQELNSRQNTVIDGVRLTLDYGPQSFFDFSYGRNSVRIEPSRRWRMRDGCESLQRLIGAFAHGHRASVAPVASRCGQGSPEPWQHGSRAPSVWPALRSPR